jgi:head-tail adaptor
MDCYFKILCAQEEIKHLNIKIHHMVTWIRNENTFLHRMEKNLWATDGKGEEQAKKDRQIAVQVRLYRWCRGHFDVGHLERFQKLSQMLGFKGILQYGVVTEHLEVRCHLRQLNAELGGEDGEGEWVDEEALEWQELEEQLHELCVQVAAEGGEEEMDVDDEEEVGEAGEDNKGHKARS